MRMLEYDEAVRRSELSLLPVRSRAVFALSCATRLLPAYRRFSVRTHLGNADEVEAIARALWRDLAEPMLSRDALEDYCRRCEQLIPREDEGRDAETQSYDVDAVAALIYTLRAWKAGDAQDAVWSGTCAYDAIDRYVMNKELPPSTSYDEVAIREHPLTQAEIFRQSRDLGELKTEPDAAGVGRFRDRAAQEALSFFGAAPSPYRD